MRNNKKEDGLKEVSRAYDAESIVADVKGGCGFYEACRKEQAKRMSPERKSLAVLADGLKLLSLPDEPSSADNADVPESMKRLNRVTKEFCIDIYGGKKYSELYPIRKRIGDLLDEILDRREKRNSAKKAQKEQTPDINTGVYRQENMSPDYGFDRLSYNVPYPQSGEEQAYSPAEAQNMPQRMQPGLSQEVLSQLPPIEVGEQLTDEQRQVLFNMLVANGCTPQEAEREIMNLGM